MTEKKLKTAQNRGTIRRKIVAMGPAFWINPTMRAYRWVRFDDGRVGVFDRPAYLDESNGEADLAQMKDGEFLVHPGFIYRAAKAGESMGLDQIAAKPFDKAEKKRLNEFSFVGEKDTDAEVEEVKIDMRGGGMKIIKDEGELK